MRESGENPEQYPLPYARESAAHGVSRSLGAILRRRSGRHGAVISAPHRASRKTYDVQRVCVSIPKTLCGKDGRGGSEMVRRGRFALAAETPPFAGLQKEEIDMKKNTRPRVLSLLLALTLILGLLPGTAWAAGDTLEGDGTADSPYLIADAADLAAFRDKVNAEDSNASYARLTADIQLTGEWVPFNSLSGNPPTAYAGTFDGGGHTIKGLKIDDKSSSNGIGLFGTVNGATIKNLKVEGTVTASNSSFVGGIVGKTQGTVKIENCSFSGSVTLSGKSGSNNGVGGIVGRVNSGELTIESCANYGTITGNGNCAAGILGSGASNKITILNCHNAGAIRGQWYPSGICANSTKTTSSITNCYNGGIVTATNNGAYCAGISANFRGNVSRCYYLYPTGEMQNSGSTGGSATKITAASELTEKLTGFTIDAAGNVKLTWEKSGTVTPAQPCIRINSTVGNSLSTEPGSQAETTLSVTYHDMGAEEPEITWSIDKSSQNIISGQLAENGSDYIVTAVRGGTATVTAAVTYQGQEYTAECKITVLPHFTTADIKNVDEAYPGNIAVGQTVKAVMYLQGSTAFNPDDYEGLTLTYRWYNGSSPVDGATGEQFTITDDFSEWDKLGVEIKCSGTTVHSYQDQQEPVRTADHGKLYPVAYDDTLINLPSDIKTDETLALPSSVTKGGITASIDWSSSNEDVIRADGTVTRPDSGTADVTLTGKYTYNNAYHNNTFKIKVWSDAAVSEETAPQTLADAADALSQSPLKPVWGTDTNVITMARARLDRAGYEDVALSIQAVEEIYGGAGISEDGGITYFYADPNTTPALHSGSFRVTFLLSKGGQTLEQIVPAVIGWDADRVKAVMRDEILSQVTEASLCDGDSLQAVTRDLTLPKAVDGKRWTLIEWTSSDEDVISISGRNQSTADPLFNPNVGVVKRGETARQVTLTAAFNFQFTGTDEAPIRLYQTFSVTVPPMETDQLEAIRKGLEEKLDAGFAAKGLSDAVTGDRLTAGADGVYTAVHDLQFPTTRDFGVDGKYFPVTITSDNSAVLTPPDVSNAARVQVLRPGPGQPDGSAAVTVSLCDQSSGVTAARSFPIRVPALTQEEIDAELALMERVKASYFEGIKGGNTAKDNVRTDLAPFFEVYEQDGALVWVRSSAQRTGRGIVPVPMEGWEDLELWRLFRSSNPNVVSHEDLKVTRQTEAKAVTVTSRLSSQTLGRYGELYQSDPARYAQYAALSPLYYQEVSTDTSIRPAAAMARAARSSADTMVVRGTRDPDSSVPVVETVDNVTFCLTGLDGSVWIAPTVLSGLEESSTVYDVFLQMLGRDYTATRVKGTYIKAISGPGGSLAEKEHGENSGWMYRVNGSIPDVYMGACPLRDGDSIQVFYTRDAQQDDPNWSWPSGGNSSSGGSSSSSGNPSGGKTEGTNRQAVQLEKLSGAGLYTVTLPKDSSGPQLVTIPNVGQGQLVVILHPDGREEVIKKSILEDNQAKFLLEENARVKVIDYANPFGDVDSSAWYRSAVDFVSGRGLFSGVGQDSFAPELPLSRGMLASVLYRLEGAGPQQAAVSFADVASGAWYAQGTAWAAEAGIVSGYGSGRFGPDDSVTREQLAVILFRYAQLLGVNTGGRDSLSEFSDSGSVSGWAREAVAWAVDAGVISGLPGETLLPAGTATRAEAAAMLQRFVRLLLK